MMDGFRRLELREAEFNAERVRRVVESELAFLESKAGDWSTWDDALQFVNGKKEDFAESNFTDEMVPTLNVNIFLYAKRSGKIIDGRAYDRDLSL